jgi:hypothetical protein
MKKQTFWSNDIVVEWSDWRLEEDLICDCSECDPKNHSFRKMIIKIEVMITSQLISESLWNARWIQGLYVFGCKIGFVSFQICVQWTPYLYVIQIWEEILKISYLIENHELFFVKFCIEKQDTVYLDLRDDGALLWMTADNYKCQWMNSTSVDDFNFLWMTSTFRGWLQLSRITPTFCRWLQDLLIFAKSTSSSEAVDVRIWLGVHANKIKSNIFSF